MNGANAKFDEDMLINRNANSREYIRRETRGAHTGGNFYLPYP